MNNLGQIIREIVVIGEQLPFDMSVIVESTLKQYKVGMPGCSYCRDGICFYNGRMWSALPFGCSFNTGCPCWAIKEYNDGMEKGNS